MIPVDDRWSVICDDSSDDSSDDWKNLLNCQTDVKKHGRDHGLAGKSSPETVTIFPWGSWRSWGFLAKFLPYTNALNVATLRLSNMSMDIYIHSFPWFSQPPPYDFRTSSVGEARRHLHDLCSCKAVGILKIIENHWKSLKVIASVQYSTRWLLLLLLLWIMIVTYYCYHCYCYY